MAVVQKQNNMPNKTKPTVKQQIKGNAKLKKAYKKSSKKQLAGIKQNLSNLSTEELMKRRKESPTKAVSAIIAGIAKAAKVAAKVGKVAAKGVKVAGKAVAKGAKAVGKGAKVAGKAVGKGATKAAKYATSEKGRKVIGKVAGAAKEGASIISSANQPKSFSSPASNFKQMNFSGGGSPFAMKGFTGFGNSPVKAKTDAAKNLLKAVPNKKAYEKLSRVDKKGFDKAAKKAGLPTKKSPAKAGQTAGQIVRRERLMTQGNTLYQVLTKIKPMTYLYYKTSTATYNQKPSEKEIQQWKHLANKANWRITQLPNGFFQTECKHETETTWHDVTRRETIEGAEAAIDGSIDHFAKKIEASAGPKVIKTFEQYIIKLNLIKWNITNPVNSSKN